MSQINPFNHLNKYGVANLDAATIANLYGLSEASVAQLESLRADLDSAEFESHFGKDLQEAQEALQIMDDYRAGKLTPEPVGQVAPVAPEPSAEPEKPAYLLEHFRRRAFEAYSNISFDPEQRAETVVREYSAELASDLQKLAAAGVSSEDQVLYQQKYEAHLSAYLSAKSRTASSMITGPANFPVERNRKRMNSERKRAEEMEEWRGKALRRAINGPRVPRTPETELEKCTAALAQREKEHELMLSFNKLLRKNKGADIAHVCELAGLTAELTKELISYRKHSGSDGFPGFHLTNNKAAINRLQGRVQELTVKVEDTAKESRVMATFEGGQVIENYELDRIQIEYDGKPDRPTIEALKKNGFRWAPSLGVWQRMLNRNGQVAAKTVTDTWNTYQK